jgi:hypothetical protein
METPVTDRVASLSWTAVIAGALAASALSFILLTFGAAIGLSISSTAPTWRDTSVALVLLSGLFLVLQAVAGFGLGGYVAGRLRSGTAMTGDAAENWDGAHGLAVWALAVLIGAAVFVGIGAHSFANVAPTATSSRTTAAEPLLSYEIDRLFRAARRPSNMDVTAERAEAGRILLSANSHSGVAADDRTFLVAQVGALTGLAPPDAERRVDVALANAKSALRRSRATSVLLAFSLAAATLLGAIAAWAAAVAGGRHRDGATLPLWMNGPSFSGRPTTLP